MKWPVSDDIGAVNVPPGGGREVGITGFDVDREDRGLGGVDAEEEGGVSTRGRTVTVRDYMAFYLFTRRCSPSKLFVTCPKLSYSLHAPCMTSTCLKLFVKCHKLSYPLHAPYMPSTCLQLLSQTQQL